MAFQQPGGRDRALPTGVCEGLCESRSQVSPTGTGKGQGHRFGLGSVGWWRAGREGVCSHTMVVDCRGRIEMF